MSPISDVLLSNLANTFGTLAVAGIVVYQFLEINAKREKERVEQGLAQFGAGSGERERFAEADLGRNSIALLRARALAAPSPVAIVFNPFSPTINLSTKSYDCTYNATLYGRASPFRVDVVRYPFDPTSLSGQVVLAVVAEKAEAGNVSWVPQLTEGQDVVVRVTDSQGNVAYSERQSVKDAHREDANCKFTPYGKHKKRKDDLSTTIIVSSVWSFFAFVLVLLLVWIGVLYYGPACLDCLSRKRRRGERDVERAQPVALSNIPQPTRTHPPPPPKPVLARARRSSSSIQRVPPPSWDGADARPAARKFGSVSSAATGSTLVGSDPEMLKDGREAERKAVD
ncbi:hypothetical protein JCM6882_004667 [Rhodosporidiobolus microsporus]